METYVHLIKHEKRDKKGNFLIDNLSLKDEFSASNSNIQTLTDILVLHLKYNRPKTSFINSWQFGTDWGPTFTAVCSDFFLYSFSSF